jgi:hypothetical protein
MAASQVACLRVPGVQGLEIGMLVVEESSPPVQRKRPHRGAVAAAHYRSVLRLASPTILPMITSMRPRATRFAVWTRTIGILNDG